MPFESLERLATLEAAALARQIIVRKEQRALAAAAVEAFFSSRVRLLSSEAYRALRLAVRAQKPPAPIDGEQPPIFTNYATASIAVASLEKKFAQVLEREVQAARAALVQASGEQITDYLLFGADGVRGLLTKQLEQYPRDLVELPPRHNAARKVEQSLLLYLQRVAAKNDTFSRFGPSAWGRVEPLTSAVSCRPEPGVAEREIFLERWTAHAMAGVMNQDPAILSELCPRLSFQGLLQGETFRFFSNGESIPLNARDAEIIATCDGRTPLHALAATVHEVCALVEKKVLQCALEVPALEPHAFEVLHDDVRKWRPGPERDRWLSVLKPIADLPGKFYRATGAEDRAELMDAARQQLYSAGAFQKVGERFLYAAVNAIGEECFRTSNFSINEDLLNEVAVEAAPWIDFWRDSYAFVASRVAGGLRQIFARAANGSDAIPLPAFLHACSEAKLPLAGPGLVGLAVMAFQEVKAAFRDRLKPHAEQPEYELTTDDCHFVRNHFDYPKFDEYTYPSADLQIAAKSFADVERGDYQWIIGELHPPVALLHHGFYWSCPDKAALNRAFAQTVLDKPSFHFGFFAADFTAHTTVRIFDALPTLSNFVAPARGNPNWRHIRPADAEVYCDKETGDVCLRLQKSGEHLGSFARAWVIPLGFHPFQFGIAPHTPRLRCGKVIVQRRAWAVRFDELQLGDFTGVSTDLVLAIEQLRAQKGWPRYIYIRPTEQALRRSGAEGRDKDTKPVFIDLESYLSLEIFQRWLKKSGELEVTEMLPDPDHLCWQEADGRRTFELRTLIVPRS